MKDYDPIVEQVITKYRKRSQLGIKKYGTTLAENNNLTQEQWLTHLQEELMDAVVYLEKIKEVLEQNQENVKYFGEDI